MKKLCFLPLFLLLFSCADTKPTTELTNDLFKTDIAFLKKEVAELEHLVQIKASPKQIQQQQFHQLILPSTNLWLHLTLGTVHGHSRHQEEVYKLHAQALKASQLSCDNRQYCA